MIYCCKISHDAETLGRALSLCGENRRRRAAAMKNEASRARSAAAGLLLRYCLLKHGFDDGQVVVSPKGRPYIEGEPLYFSLSHSGEYAVCAVGGAPVGIDIQRVVSISDRAVARFCTEGERERLSQSAAPALDAVRLWALKESFLKASGCDTRRAFEAEFLLGRGGAAKGPRGYEFSLCEELEGYVIALCGAVLPP